MTDCPENQDKKPVRQVDNTERFLAKYSLLIVTHLAAK